MPRKLSESVVVVTGASSGIGRATALAFARQGASVVLAARRAAALEEAARACEQEGARALAVPTDVTNEEAVRTLARRAVESFGRIDVWVNNAGVMSFGRFDETPMEVHRQVIETNLFGYVYGARAVLPVFKEQGAGVLVNNASMVARLSEPYASSYTMSKHGVRGLGMCLRQELAIDGFDEIHVCTVMPASIDTPIFQHAANYTGRAVKVVPPVYAAERVAETIVACAERPRREVFVGSSARLMSFQSALAPGMTERQLATLVDKGQLHLDESAPPTRGNLFEPMQEGTTISGGWGPVTGLHTTPEKARRRRRLTRGAVVGALAATALTTAIARSQKS